MTVCRSCGRALTDYDVGFYKKMVSRGADTGFQCIDCTAAYFGISTEKAWEMIGRFRRAGCTLFPLLPENECRTEKSDG